MKDESSSQKVEENSFKKHYERAKELYAKWTDLHDNLDKYFDPENQATSQLSQKLEEAIMNLFGGSSPFAGDGAQQQQGNTSGHSDKGSDKTTAKAASTKPKSQRLEGAAHNASGKTSEHPKAFGAKNAEVPGHSKNVKEGNLNVKSEKVAEGKSLSAKDNPEAKLPENLKKGVEALQKEIEDLQKEIERGSHTLDKDIGKEQIGRK